MKIKKILFLILGIVALSVFYLVTNYWEYVEQLSWDEDYDKRAKSYNAGALTNPLNFKYEEKEIYKGLDLSHHNKIIKYEGLFEYDFIYHKATEGSTFVDPKFKSRMIQILKMGIPFGGYHFFTTTASGKEQFENFKKVVPKNCPLVPVLDIENNKKKWSSKKLNRELGVWIKLCQEYYGVKPIIYSSSGFYLKNKLGQHDCMFWSGDINSTPKVKHCMHQKRFIRVSGILGLVDYDESPNIFFNLNATCFNN